MNNTRSLRVWMWLHKWSSLVCTLFMLLLCLTGLPLIFSHEIAHLTGKAVELPPSQVGQAAPAGLATLDSVVAAARARYPERVVQYASPDDEDPRLWYVTLTPTPAPTDDYRSIAVDGRDARVLAEPRFDQGFMYWMLRLHVDLFAGLPGKLFLGLMGLLLVIAIVSGVVIYAPFMRKLDFGTVRQTRGPRTRWLDLHNLLGIVTLTWALVVGATGVINTWADLLIKYWQHDQLSGLLAPYQGQPLVPEAERAPLQRSLDAAQAHLPGQKLLFIAFPGTAFSSPHHISFFMQGDTPLTSKLLRPVLVDARTAQVTVAPELPWYLQALLLSQPLHFGDYGGMPMKILWTLLDLATILVLGSGLYLWVKKRRQVVAAVRSPVAVRPGTAGAATRTGRSAA
ncbi:PepSY-associated TM helix domain-containing protein [Roseateles sp. LYH14W]|uniref:PepSY-associated TM helix domain-containing protein n=1 Tax=Pelomonas parva TaxID=3299032 RepID=A0ABW7F9P3_9BURK